MNSSALAGRRVVVSQQRPAGLADGLRQLGAIVDHVPLTEIGEPGDGGIALLGALDQIERFDWLIVTSVNGARHVGAAAARVTSVRLAAVGSATAAVLAELAGRPADFVPSVQRVEGLLAEFSPGSGEVLVAQGNLAGAELAEGLRSLGYTVRSVEAYATVVRSPDAAEVQLLRTADVVVLASGSAARVLTKASATGAALVAIGPSTAAAAVEAGLEVAAVAATPAVDEIIAAIRRSLG